MKKEYLTPRMLERYLQQLVSEEKAPATIEKYRREVERFYRFLPGDKRLSKEQTIRYKQHLLDCGFAVPSVNTMLIAVNRLLAFLGREDCRVRLLRQQRRTFCDKSRELSRAEYTRLVETARRQGKTRLSLVLQTVCSTGIRISELQFITAEALQQGRATVNCKGKSRTILLPGGLCKKLRRWTQEQHLESGPVFVTRRGRPLDRSNVWHEMQKLCRQAGVDRGKVFPHNLRHLFARTFYKAERDLAKLADLLGHSSIETTRIYIVESGCRHEKMLENLKLIL